MCVEYLKACSIDRKQRLPDIRKLGCPIRPVHGKPLAGDNVKDQRKVPFGYVRVVIQMVLDILGKDARLPLPQFLHRTGNIDPYIPLQYIIDLIHGMVMREFGDPAVEHFRIIYNKFISGKRKLRYVLHILPVIHIYSSDPPSWYRWPIASAAL